MQSKCIIICLLQWLVLSAIMYKVKTALYPLQLAHSADTRPENNEDNLGLKTHPSTDRWAVLPLSALVSKGHTKDSHILHIESILL